MITLESLEILKDHQLISLLKGKSIKIKYRDCSEKIGVVTNFISAAQASDPERTIVGLILDDIDDIGLSFETISYIEIEK